jgi:hypothetical protein
MHIRRIALFKCHRSHDHSHHLQSATGAAWCKAATLAENTDRLDIGVELLLAETGERRVDALPKDIRDGNEAAVQRLPDRPKNLVPRADGETLVLRLTGRQSRFVMLLISGSGGKVVIHIGIAKSQGPDYIQSL